MNVFIQPSGAFTITTDNTVLLKDCYPAIDGYAVRPLSVKVAKESVVYTTVQGSISYNFNVNSTVGGFHNDTLNISMTLNLNTPVHYFHAFLNAPLSQAKGFYKTAQGIIRDVGYKEVAEVDTRQTVGYGLTAVDSASPFTIFCEDLSRFETTFDMDRWFDNICLSATVNMEMTACDGVTLPTISLCRCNSPSEGVEYAAQKIGAFMGARLPKQPLYSWCSWYYFYDQFNRAQLQEALIGIKDTDGETRKLQYVQIDAGYCTSPGDWLIENHRWHGGLQQAFSDIANCGYTPGIWVGVFMVGNRSLLFQNHKDWLLKNLNGQPIVQAIADNEPKMLGYQDEEYYVLDTSHPEAMDYIVGVMRTLKDWGAGMFKTDFMYWGLQDSTQVLRHTPGKTSVEYFRELLCNIRAAIGEQALWLGCIAPFAPFIGYADAMRVGGDVGSVWSGDFGAQNMIPYVYGNNFLNLNWFQIDPDAVMLRDYHIRLTDTDIESLGLLAAMSGGCIYTSDLLQRISKERRDFFRFLRPSGFRKPFLPYADSTKTEIVMVHRQEDGDKGLVFIFNPTQDTLNVRYQLSQLGFMGDERFVPYKNSHFTIAEGELFATIKAHDNILLAVNRSDKASLFNIENLWYNVVD